MKHVRVNVRVDMLEVEILDTGKCDGPCELIKEGCMEDLGACNYDPTANVEGGCSWPKTNETCAGECKSGYTRVDGSCVTIEQGCMDPNYLEYSDSANVENENSCVYQKISK